jgi:hypothetical protein
MSVGLLNAFFYILHGLDNRGYFQFFYKELIERSLKKPLHLLRIAAIASTWF